jgi:hypothetical protein
VPWYRAAKAWKNRDGFEGKEGIDAEKPDDAILFSLSSSLLLVLSYIYIY